MYDILKTISIINISEIEIYVTISWLQACFIVILL